MTFSPKLKADVDAARAFADKANAAIQKLNNSFGGTIVKAIPGAGPCVTVLVQGCQALDMLIDAVDNFVDADPLAK